MTTHLKTRDLARRLLAYEATAGDSSERMEPGTLRVYEKLRQGLSEFAGSAGFHSLAFRALVQAKLDAPDLWSAQVAADGSLSGLGGFEPQIDKDKVRAGEFRNDEGGIALIARLLGLLHIFLGEALTLSLLRNTWPGAIFDGRNTGTGETREHTR